MRERVRRRRVEHIAAPLAGSNARKQLEIRGKMKSNKMNIIKRKYLFFLIIPVISIITLSCSDNGYILNPDDLYPYQRDTNPSWHPSGEFITFKREYYSRPDDAPDSCFLMSVDLTTREETKLAPMSWNRLHYWHPDGDKIYLDVSMGFSLIDTGGTYPVIWISDYLPVVGNCCEAKDLFDVSYTAKKVVFKARICDPYEKTGVYAYDYTQHSIIPLTGYYGYTTISPNSQKVAFNGDTGSYNAEESFIVEKDLDTEEKRIVAGPFVAENVRKILWSPDTIHVAYSLYSQGYSDSAFPYLFRIYLINMVSKDESELTEAVSEHFCWSPDGKKIAFSLFKSIYSYEAYIYIIDVSTGDLTKVTAH